MEYVKLGDLVDYRKGFAFKSSLYADTGIMVVRVSDFTLDSISENDAVYIDEDKAYNKHLLQHGDVLIQTVGSWASNPNSIVGKVVRVPKLSTKAYLNQNIVKLVPKESIDNTYLFYSLKANRFSLYCVNRGQGAANQAAITLDTILKFKFNVHSPKEQRRIASILSAYDNLIENNNRRIRLLEQMAENLYKEWFVRFRFPGHEKAEFESGLPKGWKIWSISKLCDINRKTLNSKNKGLEIEYLDTSSITCNQIVGTESYVFEEAPSRARRIVKHNSIVFSTVRPNLKHYGILKNIPDNLIVSTGFAVFDSKYDIANIIYLFLSSQEVVDYCQLIAEGAVATYPSIKPEEIGRLKIALPNIEIAEKWNGKLESLYSEILNIQKQNTLLTRQRDLLLPRLMSGKLEVKV